jgi:hypothetical protein
LFVGALKSGASTFQLGAFGQASEIQKVTVKNEPQLANGVWWYNTPNYSFGFSATSVVQQTSCDTASSDPEYRLCWHTVCFQFVITQNFDHHCVP